MKRLLLAVAIYAAPAFAQEADPLCASLDLVIEAAGGGDLPFGPIASDGKTPVDAAGKHPSFYSVDKPPGLADARTCRVDNSGSIYGLAAGPAKDWFECELLTISEDDDPDGSAKAKAAGEAMAARIAKCLSPSGWTAAPANSSQGGRERAITWQFNHATKKPVVQVVFTVFAYGRGKIVEQYDTKLKVVLDVANKAAKPR